MATEGINEEVEKVGNCPTGVLIELEVPVDKKFSTGYAALECKTQLIVRSSACELNDSSLSQNYSNECFMSPVHKFRKRSNEQNMHLNQFIKGKLQNSTWRTPSPRSMKKIRDEASRIIDRLYTSPEIAGEISLCDEELPVTCYDSDEGAENKSGVVSTVVKNNASSVINHSEHTLDKVSLSVDKKMCSNVEETSPSHCKESTDICPENNESSTCDSEYPSTDHVLVSESENSTVEIETKSPENMGNVNDSMKIGSNELATNSELDCNIDSVNQMALNQKPERKAPVLNGHLSQHTTNKIGLNSHKRDLNSSALSNHASSALPKTMGLNNGFGLRTPIRRKDNKEIKAGKNAVKEGSLISKPQTNENKRALLKPPVTNTTLAESVLFQKKLCREKEFIDSNRDAEFKKSNLQYRSLRNMKPLCKSSSLEVDTPNSTKFVRRSNSFQVTNRDKENSFIARPSPSILRPQVVTSKHSNSRSTNATPIKCANSRNIAQTVNSNLNSAKKTPIVANARAAASKKIQPAVVESLQGSFKKHVLSASNQRSRSHIGVPSALAKPTIDNLPRRLFSESKMLVKK